MRQILTIWKKEINDTIRDRRTLMAMILIPLLMMPLLIVGMGKLIEYQIKKGTEQTVKIMIANKENSPLLFDLIKKQDKIEIIENEANYKEAVAEEKLDAAAVIPPNFENDLANLKPVKIKILIKSTNEKYGSALAKIEAAIKELNDKTLKDRFSAQKVNTAILSDISIEQEDTATQKERGGFGLGFILPIFIVIWAITGGQYTAIDVSAGEKERKTLEALLLTPVKRFTLVLGKFLAVATTALVSVIVSLGSLYFSIKFFGIGPISGSGKFQSANPASPQGAIFDFSIDMQTLGLIFIVSLLLVFLFSALLLSISIFAKSFKEAQNYLGPLYLVIILPISLMNTMIGTEPDLWIFTLPAINAVALFKELLVGTYNYSHIIVTIASLSIFSLVALLAATRIYSKESVLFKN